MSGNLIDLRKRIKAVKNTQKITKAMKTVSAAKLRRATNELKKNDAHSKKFESILDIVYSAVSKSIQHPLFLKKDKGVKLLVVITADKGLCGAFNSHVLKKAESLYNEIVSSEESNQEALFFTIGNKAYRHLVKRNYPVLRHFSSIMTKFNSKDSSKIADELIALYMNNVDFFENHEEIKTSEWKEIKEIDVIYTEFESSSRQSVNIKTLFPIDKENLIEEKEEKSEPVEFIFEPSPDELFKELIPQYLKTKIYNIFLNSIASEHAARMIAMDLATRNASEMIRSLTLTMNKLRQASITKELLEIITATEALKK